ncbi:MAG: general secretion pathway protein GspB [Wenzhouxiangella sp.]
MSFILDALRKSESRRRAGDAPRLDGLPSINDPTAKRRRRRPLMTALLLLVLALPIGGLLAFWLVSDHFGGPGDGELPSQAQQTPPQPVIADEDEKTRQPGDWPDRRDSAGPTAPSARQGDQRDQPRERVISDPDEIARELERMAASGEMGLSPPDSEADEAARSALPGAGRRAAPRPVDEVARAEAQRQQSLAEQRARERVEERSSPPIGITIEPTRERPAQEPERAVARIEPPPDTRSEPTAPAAPERTVARIEPPPEAASEPAELSRGVAEYLRAWELPLSVRRNLPAMTLNIHVFSPEPDRRFVLVNGQRYVPGDLVADGVRLVDIRREGAILDFREHRFLLEP